MNWLELIRGIAPSLAQGGSLTRAGIQGIGGSILTAGAASGSIPVMAVGAAIWLGATAWGLTRHTDAAKIEEVAAMKGPQKTLAFTKIPDAVKLQAVEAMPAVKTILVREAIATDGVAAALADDKRPKVQPAPRPV